jgi:plasmid stabilization system protein ParE
VKVRYTLPALAELDAILDYLALRSPQGAARVQARIKTFINLLSSHPLIGTRTDDLSIRRLVGTVSLFGVLRSWRRRGHHSQRPARRT